MPLSDAQSSARKGLSVALVVGVAAFAMFACTRSSATLGSGLTGEQVFAPIDAGEASTAADADSGAGLCIATTCPPPWATCPALDVDLPPHACGTDLSVDVNHCGACNAACRNPSGAYNIHMACSSGQCQAFCKEHHADCNGIPDDGCESSALDDPDNCGSCGDRCPARRRMQGRQVRLPCPAPPTAEARASTSRRTTRTAAHAASPATSTSRRTAACSSLTWPSGASGPVQVRSVASRTRPSSGPTATSRSIPTAARSTSVATPPTAGNAGTRATRPEVLRRMWRSDRVSVQARANALPGASVRSAPRFAPTRRTIRAAAERVDTSARTFPTRRPCARTVAAERSVCRAPRTATDATMMAARPI